MSQDTKLAARKIREVMRHHNVAGYVVLVGPPLTNRGRNTAGTERVETERVPFLETSWLATRTREVDGRQVTAVDREDTLEKQNNVLLAALALATLCKQAGNEMATSAMYLSGGKPMSVKSSKESAGEEGGA